MSSEWICKIDLDKKDKKGQTCVSKTSTLFCYPDFERFFKTISQDYFLKEFSSVHEFSKDYQKNMAKLLKPEHREKG